MLAVPRVQVSYWDNLKPINVVVKSATDCYSSTLTFLKNGATEFKDIEELRDCNFIEPDSFRVEIKKDDFENAFQWNLNYIAERINDCR